MELDVIKGLLHSHLTNENLLSSVENQIWSIRHSKFGGRGIFARRNIRKGELIFIDKPLLLGPRTYNRYLPMCVNCYKSNSTLFPCENGCGLPVCSDRCENSTAHTNRECKYLRNLQPTCGTMWSVDLLKVVMPIRALTLCQYEKDLLGCLECHHGPRVGCDEIELLQQNVTKDIERNDKEFMLRVCQILDTNAFETAVAIDDTLSSLRGLYPLGAFLNHCCVPNARHYFNKKGLMRVKAAHSIANGEEITLAYTDSFWPTSLRWKYLTVTKNFECRCARCLDPMELGSNLSCIKCNSGECGGQLSPDSPLNSKTRWTCQECKKNVSLREVNAIRCKVKSLANEALLKSPEEIVQFIENDLTKLVPLTNYITLDLKFHVVSYFGRIDDLRWKDLTDEQLEFKSKYCTDLLQILDLVTCGDSQKKGLILYELYCTKRERFQRKLIQPKKTDEIKETYDDLDKIMNEVSSILWDDITAPDDDYIRVLSEKSSFIT